MFRTIQTSEIRTSEIQTWSFGESIDFCDACKIDTDYDNMTVVELRALMRDHGLRGYSGLRNTELIALLWDNLGRDQLGDQDPGLDEDSGLLQGLVRDQDWIRYQIEDMV